MAAYEEIHSLFGFFAELRDIDVKTVEDGCTKLAAFYHHADVDEQDLISERIHFKHHIYWWRKNEVPHPTISELYSLRPIKADSLESTFPNIEIALRIYLTMMTTNCTGERSFSKLKIVKNHLGSCMSLSLMSIESEILEDIDFHDIVRNFAENKSRKKYFY